MNANKVCGPQNLKLFSNLLNAIYPAIIQNQYYQFQYKQWFQNIHVLAVFVWSHWLTLTQCRLNSCQNGNEIILKM